MSQLSKKERRKLRQDGIIDLKGNYNTKNFRISRDIKPLNDGQEDSLDAWNEGYDVSMIGTAGTGKTFMGAYLAMKEIMDKNTPYRTLHIIRSAVNTRNQGFLPGNQKEKDAVYESPYSDIFNSIFNRGDSYDVLCKKNTVQFHTTGNLRGTTLDNCIILVDECQNMSDHELETIFTRQGLDSRIIHCGDTKQTDLRGPYDVSGLGQFLKILNNMEEMEEIEFTPDDILRSGKIKSYILSKEELGIWSHF